MAPFRWPKVEHDLALVKEYTESRPSKPDEWDEVAKRLSVVFQSEVKGRGCREHLDLLIKKHKANEKKALKRSGTEEEYSELVQLLEDVTTYQSDLATKKVSVPKRKDELDREKGLQMRNAAMITHAKRKLSTETTDDEDDDNVPVDNDDATGKKARKAKGRVGASQLLTYLSNKQEDTVKLKQRKLDMEERKLELEEKRLNLEREKWDHMFKKQFN